MSEGAPAAKRARAGRDGNPIEVGYWKIKGLGQPIRLLLVWAGFEWKDTLYECVQKNDGTYDKSSWFDVKHKLGLPFPNLPYLVDGDLKITQTNAILQHLADRAGLSGTTEEERAKVNMLFGLSGDVRRRYTGAAYSPKFDEMRPGLVESIEQKLAELDQFLGSREYLVGQGVTVSDLLWYDLIDQFLVLDPTILDQRCPNLRAFHSRFHNDPKIVAYRESNRFITQLNNTQAFFK